MSREAMPMQMALEALELYQSKSSVQMFDDAVKALRQALVDADDTSQKRVDEMVKTEHDRAVELGKAYERGWNAALAQQEPVAWISEGGDVSRSKRYMDEMGFKCNPLYTAPPKQWVGLTEEEVFELADTNLYDGGKNYGVLAFARAVEQALKEKNHG